MERRWTREDLARRSGVKIRTIRLWESEYLPRTGHDDTVRGLAAAYGVEPEVIADWLDYDHDVDEVDQAAGGAPSKSTLALRAERDAVTEWLARPDGERLELMSPRLLHRIKTAPGLCADKRYAVSGKVRDHRDMPSIVAGVLGRESMVCGQFLLVRRVSSGDVCYASIFSGTRAQTARLLDFAEARQAVTVIVRMALREPDKEFKGFFFFQKKGEKPKPHKWCFVVDEVTDGDLPVEIEAAPAAAGAQPKPRAKLPRARLS
jgi:transcriptional regulator with XRE-family HTH domain